MCVCARGGERERRRVPSAGLTLRPAFDLRNVRSHVRVDVAGERAHENIVM